MRRRRKPCPKAPKVLPGDLYNCTLPFLGAKVSIDHRDPSRSVAGIVQGCRKKASGRGYEVVVGKTFARGTVKRALGLAKPRTRRAAAGRAPQRSTEIVLARPRAPMLLPRAMELPRYMLEARAERPMPPAPRPVLALPAPARPASVPPKRTAARRSKRVAPELVPVREPAPLAPSRAALTTESFRNGPPRPVLGHALVCAPKDHSPGDRKCEEYAKAVRTIEPLLMHLPLRWNVARESVAAMRAWLEGRVSRAVAERSRFMLGDSERNEMWGTTEQRILSAVAALWMDPLRAESSAKNTQARVAVAATPIDYARLYREAGGDVSWLTRNNPTLSPPPWPSREQARAELVEMLSEDPEGYRFVMKPRPDSGGREMGVWRTVLSGGGPALLEQLQSKLLDWKVDWIRALPVWRRRVEKKDPFADDVRKVESQLNGTLHEIADLQRFLAAEWTNPAEHATARAVEKRAQKIAPYVARWRAAVTHMEPIVRKTVAAITAWAPGARQRFLDEAQRTPELRVHEAKERIASAVAVFDTEVGKLSLALAGESTRLGREGTGGKARGRQWDKLAEALNILDTLGSGRWRDWGYKRERLTSGGGKYTGVLGGLAERVLVDPARAIVEKMVSAIGGPKAADQLYADSHLLAAIAEHEDNAWDWLGAWTKHRFDSADRPSQGMFRWVR